MFRPSDHLLWDFWTVRAGDETHLFYLRAPRDLSDPELRHARATVGHAVSRDLWTWRDLHPALGPGPPGAWDDRAIWTGSAAELLPREGGGYAMLYTGCCHADDGKTQRIGLALSKDLTTWRKHPSNPVIEADPRWYLEHNALHYGETAWRDPFLMRDPEGNGWLAYVTAQTPQANPRGSGAIGLARSADLVTWRVEPPVACPGWTFHMEIPQLWRQDDRSILIFNATADWITGDAPIAARHGTYYLVSDRHDGGFTFGGVLLAGDAGEYGLKLLRRPDGSTASLAWLGYQTDGTFAGALSDPMDVRFKADGRILVG